MRALLGWILALGLAVSPAMAKAGGAAGEDSPATTKTDKPAASTTTPATPGVAAAAKPAAANLESELDELRDVLQSQAKQIQEQSDLLKQQQEKMDALAKQLKTSGAAPENIAAAPATTTMASAVTLPSASPIPAASSPIPAAIAATPQAAEEKPSPLYFSIGSAHFTPGGFMDLTNIFRSKTIGSGIGTSFNGTPYNNSFPTAGLTEDRFSAQNSRITMRVDAKAAGGDAVGYLEADFLGVTNDNLNVTSNSNSLRMRVYFIDFRKNKWEVFAGQDWSMLTPNRNGIGFMPADVFNTQDVDTNYQLGLVWERTPQFRFVLHPTKTVAFGVSVENSQQYVGSGVTLPASLPGQPGNTPQLDPGQSINNVNGVNTGSNGLAVANAAPDVIVKLAFDPKFGTRSSHFEVSGLYRTFRINNGILAGVNLGNTTKSGAGISFNSNFEIFKNFRLYETAFWSSGGGREIGNSNVPDLIVTPANTATGAPNASNLLGISPVHSGSGIVGFEWQTMPKLLLYGYWSGVYVSRDTAALNNTAPCTSAATCVGYGFTGSASSNNRNLQEGTVGLTQVFWRNANYGALSLMIQGSYLSRTPWNPLGTGVNLPKDAHLGMVYANIRYTLP